LARSLVIVESPAKAKTILKYLGKGYSVKASVGHVRDLPKSKLGVDEENDFAPTYEILDKKAKVVSELKKAADDADHVYIATDPDREGEAIGWHLAEILDPKGKQKAKFQRVLFNEITPKGVKDGMAKPREIDRNLVDAQQARRVLDRLMGYKLSPLLWDKVRRGLSAGRVQSVALKMVCDREDEIEAFQPEEYWTFAARLAAAMPPEFVAKLTKIAGKKAQVGAEPEARTIEKDLKAGEFKVAAVAKKEKKQNPLPPFTTSKLQQAAANRHRLPVKRTMGIAQGLYEGKELGELGTVGLITYMRTDSVRVSDEALDELRAFIGTTWSAAHLPEKPTFYKSKKGAQEGHEAIRPTNVALTPDKMAKYLDRDDLNVYRLIWERFVASQMTAALFDVTDVTIENGKYELRATGETLKFAGHLAARGIAPDAPTEEEEAADAPEEDEGAKAKSLPALSAGDPLKLVDLDTKQNFTQPPPRFTEATLVKALEENGIGRPSTYAAILTTLSSRDYTDKREGKIHPTALGRLVTKQLIGSFEDIVNESYTAQLEDQLDEIEEGKLNWIAALKEFSKKFEIDLERARKEMPKVKGEGIATDEKCEKCGSPMVIKFGRFGEFLACSNYPDCKTTRDPKKEGEQEAAEAQPPCETCGKEMVMRRGRFGPFWSCSGYPECKTIRKIQKGPVFTPIDTGFDCPQKCGGRVFEKKSRRGKIFFGCNSYPKCEFALWNRPVDEHCPNCDRTYLQEKTTKRDGTVKLCDAEGCGFKEKVEKLAS
jgi:DNA topoisomerase I